MMLDLHAWAHNDLRCCRALKPQSTNKDLYANLILGAEADVLGPIVVPCHGETFYVTLWPGLLCQALCGETRPTLNSLERLGADWGGVCWFV